MDEIHYVWADPSSPQQQVALSSIIQAMHEKNCMGIARWVSRGGMDPKMGVLVPILFDKVDCLIWSHVSYFVGYLMCCVDTKPSLLLAFDSRCHLQTM